MKTQARAHPFLMAQQLTLVDSWLGSRKRRTRPIGRDRFRRANVAAVLRAEGRYK
jgi:hypothetical protein